MNDAQRRPARAIVIAVASILALAGASGCVSEGEHERVTRELSKAQIEAAQRAGEVVALRQMLYYAAYTSSPRAESANQASMMQLARAYSDLVQRYGALSADVEALKRRDSEHRASDPLPPPTPTSLPRRASSRPVGASDVVDPFMDR